MALCDEGVQSFSVEYDQYTGSRECRSDDPLDMIGLENLSNLILPDYLYFVHHDRSLIHQKRLWKFLAPFPQDV